MALKHRYLLVIVLVASLFLTSQCKKQEKTYSSSNANQDDLSTDISPECAAVLLVGGGVAGSAATAVVSNLLSPIWLCSGGFCAAGVKAGSLAAWWQSAMPLVASSSLFATLQSIATTGASGEGAESSTAFGKILGVDGGVAYLQEFCRVVDQVEQGTTMHKGIKANLEFYRRLSFATKAASPYVMEARKVASAMVTGVWSWASDVAADFEKVYQKEMEEARVRESEKGRKRKPAQSSSDL